MCVPRSQSCAQKIALVREAKQGVKADLAEAAIKCGAFLISMDGIVCGIYVDYKSPFISPSKQSVATSAEPIFQGG